MPGYGVSAWSTATRWWRRGEADLNNYIRANNRLSARQRDTEGGSNGTPISTAERIFANELPDKAVIVNKTRQEKRRNFTNEEIDQMVADYTEHELTLRQLADKYRCNRKTVSTKLKQRDVIVTRQRIDEDMTEKARLLYADGLTLAAVGERLGVSESAIGKALAKSGVAIRSKHRFGRQTT